MSRAPGAFAEIDAFVGASSGAASGDVLVSGGISVVIASRRPATAITATTTPIAKTDAVRHDFTALSGRGSMAR